MTKVKDTIKYYNFFEKSYKDKFKFKIIVNNFLEDIYEYKDKKILVDFIRFMIKEFNLNYKLIIKK